MISLLGDCIESEVGLATRHTLVDGGKHRDRSLLLGSQLLDHLDALVDLFEFSFEFVLSLNVGLEFLGFFFFSCELSLGGGVRVVGPELIDAYRDQEDHQRRREHEQLLPSSRGDLGLLNSYAVFGGASK